MKKNNKGFTLIELLAVIVILAVLILVALPAVTNLMTRARKSALRTEALDMARNGVQLAYSANMLSGTSVTPSGTISAGSTAASNIVYKVSGGEYLCMTFTDLVNKGYIEKSNTTGYNGHVSIFVDNAGKAEMYIHLTNGTYFIKSSYVDLANNNDIDGTVSATSPSGYSNPCPEVKADKTKADLLK